MKFRLRLTSDTVNLRIDPKGYEKEIKLDWFTYVPFVGWLYPFIIKKDNAFSMQHGTLSFCMAVLFTAIPLSLTFISVFIAVSLREVRLAVAILIYLSHALYLGLSIWGTMMVYKGQPGSIPVISTMVNRLNIWGTAQQ